MGDVGIILLKHLVRSLALQCPADRVTPQKWNKQSEHWGKRTQGSPGGDYTGVWRLVADEIAASWDETFYWSVCLKDHSHPGGNYKLQVNNCLILEYGPSVRRPGPKRQRQRRLRRVGIFDCVVNDLAISISFPVPGLINTDSCRILRRNPNAEGVSPGPVV